MSIRTVPPSAEKRLRPREAAERLGITTQTLDRWARDGKPASTRDPGGRRLYEPAVIDALLAEMTAAGAV